MSSNPRSQIRPIVLGLVRREQQILVCETYDAVRQKMLYRAPGGGIEFGETSRDALHREFQEEFQAEIGEVQYLGCIENFFVFETRPGHELVQLYQCSFLDSRFYQLEAVGGIEGIQPFTARWISIDRFKSGELHLVPETCLRFL
jgi:8-oxo-dGTP pyrophosphatase MutT (NUDIX family)